MTGLDSTAPKEDKKHGARVFTFAAVGLWVLAIGLGFVIPPQTGLIWIPDTLLLLGFWPFLCQLKARWLWLVFGLFNLFIGFTLEVTRYLPDKDFSFDPKVLAMKTHLAQYHEPFAWMGIGVISALIGILRIVMWIVSLLSKRTSKSNPEQ